MLEIYGLIFTCILGTIGHFLYKITNKNKIIGFLFATNESTWEHLKLGITPIIIWSIIEFIITLKFNTIINTALKITTFITLIISLYYLYRHLFKKNILIIDIAVFYFATAFSYLIGAKLINTNYSLIFYFVAIIFYILLYMCYKNFTKNQPNNFLFKY